jgi:hypothetical protein
MAYFEKPKPNIRLETEEDKRNFKVILLGCYKVTFTKIDRVIL